jgi:hypothetical protein
MDWSVTHKINYFECLLHVMKLCKAFHFFFYTFWAIRPNNKTGLNKKMLWVARLIFLQSHIITNEMFRLIPYCCRWTFIRSTSQIYHIRIQFPTKLSSYNNHLYISHNFCVSLFDIEITYFRSNCVCVYVERMCNSRTIWQEVFCSFFMNWLYTCRSSLKQG